MKVTSRVQLTRMIRNVLDDTGEGVILRLPRSLYLPGRSTSLLKLKAARSDMEALVIQVLSDSCVLRLPSGFIFSARINLNSSAEDLQENTKGGERIEIKEGDIVTVAFNGKRGGMEIVRVRRDVTWASVLNSTRPSPNLLKQYSEKVVDYSPRTYGYWVHARRKQMRKFLEKIMFNLKLDPLIPSCWYTVSPDQFKLFKGGKTLLGKFDGSLAKAAMYLFPDIGLKLHKFSYAAKSDINNRPRGFWAIPTNRKQFFDTFAQVHKFDFLQPSNWYKVSEHSIFSTKNASSVLRYYEGDYVSALTEIYPNIGLERAKFRTT